MPASPRFSRFLASAAAPAAILSVALALRCAFHVGYANVDPWDDTLYLELAAHHRSGTLGSQLSSVVEELEAGTLTTPEAFIARRGAYLPVSLAQQWLGVSEVAASLPSLLSSLGTILLTFHLASLLAGRTVALWAALAYCFVPLDILFSTRVLAGTLQTFWIAAAITAAAHAARREGRSLPRHLCYAASGFSLYLAYATRLNALVALPLVALAARPALRSPALRRELVAIPAALLGLLLVEGALSQILWGKPFLFPSLELRGARTMFEHNPELILRPVSWLAVHVSYLEGVPHFFFKLFFGTVDHYGGLKLFSVFAPLGIIGLIHAIRTAKDALVSVWLAGTFLYVQYGFRALEWEGGMLHYFLNAHRPRYLLMLLPPLAIVVGMLADVARRRTGRLWTSIGVGMLMAVCMYHAREGRAFYRGSMADVRAAARFLRRAEPAPVLSDGWAVRQLRFYDGGDRLELRRLGRGDPPPGSWVVLGGGRGAEIPQEAVEATVPSKWRALYRDPDRAPPHWRAMLRVESSAREARERGSALVVFRVLETTTIR